MRGFFNWLAGIPVDTPVSLGVSQARLFAAQYVKRMARQVLVTLTWVRRAATAIMIIAMAVSFNHQTDYLLMLGASMLAACAIPAALDCLTFICVKVLATSAVVRIARWVAGVVLVFTVSGSGTLNFLAPGPMVLKWVFVGAMLLIPLAETVASQIKPDFRKMAEMEAMLNPVTNETVPVVVPTVTPAVALIPEPVAVIPAAEAAPEALAEAEAVEPAPVAKPENTRPRRKPRARASKSFAGGVSPTGEEIEAARIALGPQRGNVAAAFSDSAEPEPSVVG